MFNKKAGRQQDRDARRSISSHICSQSSTTLSDAAGRPGTYLYFSLRWKARRRREPMITPENTCIKSPLTKFRFDIAGQFPIKAPSSRVQVVIHWQNLCTVAAVGELPNTHEEALHDETADFPLDGTRSPVHILRVSAGDALAKETYKVQTGTPSAVLPQRSALPRPR